jgi:hypothetical protein
MKYYLYISDSKIEMLFQQIQVAHSETREASLGFDLKLLKGNIKDSRGLPKNQFVKLSKTLNALQDRELIGGLDSDKEYISATLMMRWGAYGSRLGALDSPITFWGHSSFKWPFAGLALALAGSSYHLLGEQRGSQVHSHSLTAHMVKWFLENLDEPFKKGDFKKFERAHDIDRPLDDYDIANGAWLAATQISGQSAMYEFVAKVLHRSEWSEGFRSTQTTKIILATPLYVTLVE